MGILEDGPNGGFRGKVGSVYGYNLNGKCVIRGARKKSTKPPTPAQLAHREKIKLSSVFCRWIKPIVNFGYQFEETKNSGRGKFQLAQQRVFKNAIDVDATNKPFINLEKVQVFVGELMSPEGVQARWEEGLLKLSWIPNPKYKDSLFKLNLALVSLDREVDLRMAIADAAEGECAVNIPVFERGKFDYHVYIGFWDTYHGAFSNSAYCGVI
ncbi:MULTISPECIES: DUF6266 family protein [unclassified Sphingobacterium]|uniref:DUF6266 family protein n=1 Tax=unclassified Sphingobacterium TaxID=2609468 RepID=UPI0025D92BE8|nr:DUF6266 family protein [Sphingobacterium sp. UBA5670]